MVEDPGFSTPKRTAQSKELTGLQDTPHSRGSGSHVAHQTAHTQKVFATYLREDLQSSQSMTNGKAFEIILGLEETSWQPGSKLRALFNEIVHDGGFQSRLAVYCQPAAKEEERYPPFIDLSNYILGVLKKGLQRCRKKEGKKNYHLANHNMTSTVSDPDGWDLLFCRNDPHPIQGSAACRVPDGLGVWRRSLLPRRLGEVELSHPASHEPFHWLELLMFLEFKRIKGDLTGKLATQTNDVLGNESTVSPVSLTAPSGDIDSITRSIKSGSTTDKAASSSTPAKLAGPRRDNSAQPKERGATRAQAKVVDVQESDDLTSDELVCTDLDQLPNNCHSGDKRVSTNEHYSKASSQSKKQKVDVSQQVDVPQQDEELVRNPDLQCASYALEMLSHGGLRSHVIGLLITDDEINLCYYDRSVVVKATSFSFVQEPIRFVAMLYALSQLKKDQWGFDPAIEQPRYLSGAAMVPKVRGDGKRYEVFEKTEMKWNDEVTITLGKEIFHQHSIIGRGTCVLEADVIKHDRRKSEVVIVRKLRERAVEDEESRNILDHLPLILDAQDFPARGVQAALKEYFDERDRGSANTSQHPIYEERVLRMTLQERLLPIAPLREKVNRARSEAKLAKIFQDIFICYKWVHETGKILHRDISINNLMYREDEAGRVSGVLIDYDMAVDVDREPTEGQTSKQRTGTKPFMAKGLLMQVPERHAFRHDLESLFYCYLWMLLKKKKVDRTDKPDPEQVPEKVVHIHPLQLWEYAPMFILGSLKGDLLFTGQVDTTYKEFGSHFWVCQGLLKTMGEILYKNAKPVVPPGVDPAPTAGAGEPTPSTAVELTFTHFENHLCGGIMQELKGQLINAPYHIRLASLFNII